MSSKDAARPGTATHAGHRFRGSSLLEALVALVVLAIATLGTMAGFAVALRSSHSALLRIRAVELAAELAEQWRAAAPGNTVDLGAWQQAVALQLPNPDPPQLDCQGERPTACRITLRWADRLDTARASQVSLIELASPETP